jgi:hypothetical protein
MFEICRVGSSCAVLQAFIKVLIGLPDDKLRFLDGAQTMDALLYVPEMDDIIAVTTPDYSQNPRVITSLPGRYMLANQRDAFGERHEFNCWIMNISVRDIVLAAPVVGAIGERVIVYNGIFGTLHGPILRQAPNGFVISIVASKEKQRKLRTKLAWLVAQQQGSKKRDSRRDFRIIPQDPLATLTLEDGSSMLCLILNVSVCGAAVSADYSPNIGAEVAVGQMRGRVVRLFPEGFAIEFTDSSRCRR